MNMNRGLFCLSITFVMWYGGIAQGQELPSQKIIDVKMRAADPRLDTPVTVDVDRAYLGEVLEKVSVQTGVSVSIPAEDLYSGVPITCHVKNIPLANFMNALWSLVGFSKATWQITPAAQHQPPGYQFLPTASSRALSARLDRETEVLTANLIALLLKMHAMTPKERQANMHNLSQAMLRDNDAMAKTYVEDSTASAHFWSMIGLFATVLTPDQQAQVLKGETISVPLNHLDADTQAMLLATTAHYYTEVNGVRTEKEPSDTVRFSTDHAFGKKKHMIADLCIGIGTGQRFTTSNFLGGIEFGLAAIVYEGWILPGDLRHAEPEKQTVGTLPDLSQNILWGHVAPFDLLLAQLADAQHVSYIAVVPDDAKEQVQVSVGKSARQCLDDLKLHSSLMHKWRDGVLLFNYPVWFYGDDAQFSYAVIKPLRESRQRNANNPLTLPDIANAVITLNDVQMKRLAQEFPQIDNNKPKRPIFVFYKKYPRVLSEEGVAVDLIMVATLKELNLMLPLAETDSLQRMRIIEKADPRINDGRRLYRVQIQTAKQKEWRQVGDVSILPNRTAPR
jgi:hypothetical protein